MSTFLVINIVLGLIVLIAIVALVVWAIRTQGGDDIGGPAERRHRKDRRRRVVDDLPSGAERGRRPRRGRNIAGAWAGRRGPARGPGA